MANWIVFLVGAAGMHYNNAPTWAYWMLFAGAALTMLSANRSTIELKPRAA